jgi:hypothetical protein
VGTLIEEYGNVKNPMNFVEAGSRSEEKFDRRAELRLAL